MSAPKYFGTTKLVPKCPDTNFNPSPVELCLGIVLGPKFPEFSSIWYRSVLWPKCPVTVPAGMTETASLIPKDICRRCNRMSRSQRQRLPLNPRGSARSIASKMPDSALQFLLSNVVETQIAMLAEDRRMTLYSIS